MARAWTVLFSPLPRADHVPVVVFHFAIRFAGMPPAVVKYPPTYTSVPVLLIAMAVTLLLTPGTSNPLSQFSSPGASDTAGGIVESLSFSAESNPGSSCLVSEGTKRGSLFDPVDISQPVGSMLPVTPLDRLSVPSLLSSCCRG